MQGARRQRLEGSKGGGGVMNQVWKFEVPMDDGVLEMPMCAEVLSVAFQGQKLMMWALVDIEVDTTKRYFIVRGTGHNIRLNNLHFIGTAFIDALVFHVFENL